MEFSLNDKMYQQTDGVHVAMELPLGHVLANIVGHYQSQIDPENWPASFQSVCR